MKMDVTVSVEKSGYEVMQAVASLVGAVKKAHSEGASLIEAIPADVAAALQYLAPIVSQVSSIPAEAVEDRAAMLKGVLLGGVDLASALLG